jgi:hypothetical protein
MLYINNLFILLESRSPARFSSGSIASIRFEICVHRFCTTKLSCFLSIKSPEKSWVQLSFTGVSVEIVEHTGNSVNCYLQEVFGNHQLLFCSALDKKALQRFTQWIVWDKFQHDIILCSEHCLNLLFQSTQKNMFGGAKKKGL